MARLERTGRDGYPAYRRSFSRSGWATAIVIGALLLAFGLVWHAHQRAKFHQLTAPVIPQTTSAPMPGGQEAIMLSRVALVNDAEPEFVSATVLPGIGMQLLQAAVAVPNQSVQNLLSSVSVSDAARMTRESITSAPFHLRVSTHHLREKATNDEDLIGLMPATSAQNQTLVDGGMASGTFGSAKGKDGISATLDVTLSGRQIDMVAHATNNSEESRFVAFEWQPHFAVSKTVTPVRLYVPSRNPPGRADRSPVSDPSASFTAEGGGTIGSTPFDLRFSLLAHDYLSDGTYLQLQNGDQYYLRILGLGDSLRSVHAVNDPATHTLLLGVSSMEFSGETEQQDQTLRPGQTMQWHLRLEVLTTKSSQGPDALH